MEPIQSAMKKWINSNKRIKDNVSQQRSNVLNDPDIKKVLSNHLELDEQDINRHLMKLYEYQQASKNCEQCPHVKGCKNIIKGYTPPQLDIDGKDISLRYEKCKNKIHEEAQLEKEALVGSLYIPKKIKQAKLGGDMDSSSYERKAVVREIIEFVQNHTNGTFHKGLYIHGPFGTGKSFILGVIANELKNRSVKSDIIYMPELVREMKASIKNDSLQSKIERFKKVEVLMLDDIGAESISSWFRDEVLGAILQYRMMEDLPVFFTSNYNLEQLEEHLATSNRGDVETIKAGRIVERIMQLSKPLELTNRYRMNE
ncbi:helicase loader DnaI [Gracilibacillus boraciitolerans JCM 21714]|uniref:Helicase loader DnaI n=1 Tax=Gracilibacillus boraciitolerans JCM 21714 TaxID=1298598 RepID=W4VJR8_9BACI|nr:primosomal protein DnaI [Gracilibacillus boraciitolerans]GAE93009.1 helicase loader DnaI [Gracilibacillus boraciitolerans JCM 21714]